MVRERWTSLNGLWDYAVTAADAEQPEDWAGKILVPFPIESALSGVGRRLEPGERLWYRRTFRVPDEWKRERVLLHFGAVDWRADVSLNGRAIGSHEGGYDGFELDVTDALVAGDNTLVVRVEDPSDSGGQPRGKQVLKPEGIWYTPSSGIWQTVWLEPVPAERIVGLTVTPRRSPRESGVSVRVERTPPPPGKLPSSLMVDVLARERSVASGMATGSEVLVHIADPHPWSPGDPYLYGLRVSLGRDGRTVDAVRSYCGLRDVRMGDDGRGVQRLLLNGEPLFQLGPLDQGFWPDGLYTPPSDEAMRFDIGAVKKMGGNMLRKHVKVECERFYYACDQLGVLVWQDMPSANNASPEDKARFEGELTRLVLGRSNHPSIVTWVPFNEGWGQHDTGRIVDLVRRLDPTRLVDNASGWTDERCGDVIDVHDYPGPAMAPAETKRASVLGEFGGLGLPIEGHTWVDNGNWGYVRFANQAELTDAYVALLDKLRPLISNGLSAAVYTQATDVEIECNGWLTYDRAVWKIDPERAASAASRLYGPPPRLRVLVPHAGDGEIAPWRYTTDAPADGWYRADFVDRSWKQGRAGFGSAGTPGAVIGTEWTSSDIWIRRTFELASADLAAPWLSIHHDEDVEVFVNGERALEAKGYTVGYVYEPLGEAARGSLRPGANTLAVHCRQTTGGQYIDVGLVELVR
jgi:hypothetical protein